MKEEIKHYLPRLSPGTSPGENPALLRIIISSRQVQVDFGYAAPLIYKRGGWIKMAPYTYLQVQGMKKKFRLLDVHNIPLSPEQHHFESIQDWQVFTLFFEPIPIKDCVIDIIEEERPTANDFNYYGIKISEVRKIEVLPFDFLLPE